MPRAVRGIGRRARDRSRSPPHYVEARRAPGRRWPACERSRDRVWRWRARCLGCERLRMKRDVDGAGNADLIVRSLAPPLPVTRRCRSSARASAVEPDAIADAWML